MLFRSLAVLAVIPSFVLALPVDSINGPGPKRSLKRRCKARDTPPAPVSLPAPASSDPALQGLPSAPSGTDAVNATVVPVSVPAPAPTQQAPPPPPSPPPAASSSSSDASAAAPPAPTSTTPTKTTSKPSESAKPTKSDSDSSPASTSTSTDKPSNADVPVTSGLISALLPKGQGNDLWSTAKGLVSGAVKLTMSAFNANSVMSRAPAIFTPSSLKVNFKAGSWTYKGPGPSGLSFYAQPMDLSAAREVTLSYQIKFDPDFDFNMGGKLPGIYGGESDEDAKSCSGGRRDTKCHSARFMWRTEGKGELYTYLPDPSFGAAFAGNKNLCTDVPNSECNSVYGASVGRGAFSFPKGEFMTIAQRARLNDVGKANGELELIVDGESKFTVRGLAFRDSEAHKFRGIQMQSFFGGSSQDWASPKDQSLEMKDFSLAVTQTF